MTPVESALILFGSVLGIGVIVYLFIAAPASAEEDLTGQRLSAPAIASVARQAGFYGDNLVTAVAIALAESEGKASNHGDTSLGSGTGSFGLWQIYSDAHPEYGPDFSQLYDPQTNANAAYNVYVEAGNSFQPWSTYNRDRAGNFVGNGNGWYREFLTQAQAAV